MGRCRGVCRFGARLCQCRGSSSSNSTSRPLYRTRVGRLTWGTVHTYSSDGWCSAAAALVRHSAAAPAFLPPVGRGRLCGPPGRTPGWPANAVAAAAVARRAEPRRSGHAAMHYQRARLCQRSRAERVGGFGLRDWLGKARPAVERRDSFAQRRKTKGMH